MDPFTGPVLTTVQRVLPADSRRHWTLDRFWRLVGPETHEASVIHLTGQQDESSTGQNPTEPDRGAVFSDGSRSVRLFPRDLLGREG